ncbi:MAG: penicillin-binding protein activator [Rhodospirillales bacterium]|nr:penicillin-binding protein activator [Rhodospirillales bacterium]
MRAASRASLSLIFTACAALAFAACTPQKTRTVSTTAQATAASKTADPLLDKITGKTAGKLTSKGGTAPAVPQGRILPAGQPVKVAMLLPLSGRLPQIGEQLMNAAQLALFELPPNSLELLIEDAGDTPEMAAQAMQRALHEGAQLALGPLLARQVRPASNVARSGNVNLIAFSNDTRQLDGYAFSMGLTPAAQAERVVSYAVAQGYGQVAILAPDTDFGRQSAQGAQNGAVSAGGRIVSTVFYPAQQIDITESIRSLAGPYRALLLPDRHDRMSSLAPALGSEGITPATTRFLGSGLWHSNALLTEPNLQGSWFPTADPQTYNSFAARYREAYGSTPQPLAAMAFDAVTLAGYLARQIAGQTQARQARAATATPGQWVGLDRNSLLNPAGFSGVGGIFRFRTDGAAQRGLAILQIDPDGFSIAAPAPAAFPALTN